MVEMNDLWTVANFMFNVGMMVLMVLFAWFLGFMLFSIWRMFWRIPKVRIATPDLNKMYGYVYDEEIEEQLKDLLRDELTDLLEDEIHNIKIEDNLLVAEFMGKEVKTILGYPAVVPLYYSNWKHLMGVLDEIEASGFSTEIVHRELHKDTKPYLCKIQGTFPDDVWFNEGIDKIEITFKTVVEFIKYFKTIEE